MRFIKNIIQGSDFMKLINQRITFGIIIILLLFLLLIRFYIFLNACSKIKMYLCGENAFSAQKTEKDMNKKTTSSNDEVVGNN